MRTRIGWGWVGLLTVPLVVAVLGCSGDLDSTRGTGQTPPAPPPKVEMKPIKFADFDGFLKQHRGKVVLVDFWADFCGPCKKAFPNLIKMHERYAWDGLVIVTVNIDRPADIAALASALDFLKRQKATFTNLKVHSEETPDIWTSRLGIKFIPHKLLYNREGQPVDLPADHTEVELEQTIKKLVLGGSGAGN